MPAPGPIRVSLDGHFLQHTDGTPFFYLADTAWMLVNKLTESEARRLFEDRAAKGFTVVQSLVFRDLFEPNTPNVAGIRPFASEADMWAVRLNPLWIESVLRITKIAAEYGLIMGWLPTWGDKWNTHSNSAGPVIMDASSAREYCRILSDAMAKCENVIWILGGDSPIKTQAEANIVHAMAAGIREGNSADRLITFHPVGGSSSAIFHSADWLDFNALQSGHAHLNIPNYEVIDRLYRMMPHKPCLDIEPNYEGIPVSFERQNGIDPEQRAFFNDYDVRRSLYRSVLGGAAGFTYGCDPIRQMYRKGDRSHAWDGAGMPTWSEALSAPGSSQLKLLKETLMERSYFTRVPAQELLCTPSGNTDPVAHVSVARCREGRYIFVYVPIRQMLTINTSGIDAQRLRISVYDPETCQCIRSWETDNDGILHHIPARQLDSLIVVDAI